MFAYSNNGISFRAWNEPYDLIDGEIYFDHEPTEDDLKLAFPNYETAKINHENEIFNSNIGEQIAILELKQARSLREIALGQDSKVYLQAIENQIISLRSQLK
jgi:hypothetical protein